MSNPFREGDGEPIAGGPGSIRAEQGAKDLCPFLGMMGIPVPKPGRLVGGGQHVEIVPVFQACIRGQCAFWDQANSRCAIRTGFDCLPEIFERLAPLANMFGNRA